MLRGAEQVLLGALERRAAVGQRRVYDDLAVLAAQQDALDADLAGRVVEAVAAERLAAPAAPPPTAWLGSQAASSSRFEGTRVASWRRAMARA